MTIVSIAMCVALLPGAWAVAETLPNSPAPQVPVAPSGSVGSTVAFPAGSTVSAPGAPAGSQGNSPGDDDAAMLATTAATGPVQILTLEGAVAEARAKAPVLLGAAAGTTRAAAGVRTARAYTNPLVEVFAGHQSARPIATPGVPGLLTHYAAYQTVEIPAERRARVRTAELAGVSARFGQTSVELSVVGNAKRAFYEVLRRREEIGHQRENFTLVQDLRRRVEVEVRVGEKGRLELTRAEAELARARFAVRSAQLEYATSIANLRAAIAAAPETNLDPRGELEPMLRLAPLPELREKVLATHPALAQARTDVEAGSASLTRERAVRIPQPALFAEYERQPDLTFWRAGATVQLPLWNRNEGRIAESQAVIRQAAALLDQRRLEITSSLERAYEQYQLADQQATSLESGSLHEAESAVEAAKAAYQFGERGIVEVLDAQRVLQSVRGDLLDAQYARQFALVDLEELGAVTPGRRP